jgi:GntR family transcriptional repressor for pyruvate dehydrogenase complex
MRDVLPKNRSGPPLKPSVALVDRLAADMGPIRSEHLTEHLVRQMKSSILRGVLKPGERLPPERELASLLNVSRSSLRQALKALQIMGVLEVRHGSGNYLAETAASILREAENLLVPLRGMSFGELYEARRAMEAEAAACAALRATKMDLAKLAGEIDRMRLLLHDPRAFMRHDMAFHRHIAAASGNSFFIWLIELIQKILEQPQRTHMRNAGLGNLLVEHERIAHAIEAGDPHLARMEVLGHLTLGKAYPNQPTAVELRALTR